MSDNEIKWKHCPGCGTKLPNLETQKFCINCGLDLLYVKQYKALPPPRVQPAYKSVASYPSPRVQPSYKSVVSYPSPRVQPSYKSVVSYPSPTISYDKYKPMSDDEILETQNRELWGNLPSIGFPLLSFLIMNAALFTFLIAFILIFPYDIVYSVLTNPLFIILSTFVELVLLIFPIYYTGRYLENPNLKNRLTLLGFTTKRYDRVGLLKEIGIGIGFAFVGLQIVIGAGLLIQFIYSLFGIRFVESGSGDAEVIITGMDVFYLIIMMLMMMIIVGPCEEIVFRGFMQRGLVRNLGDRWGILITALIFAGIHLLSLIFYALMGYSPIIILLLFIYFFVPYFAISLMLGLLFRWREQNLIAVVITHGVYNSLTLLIVFLFMVYY